MPRRIYFSADDARDYLILPAVDAHKYSRGVLGAAVGSDQYPGAALLVADAALHTGVGMLRYFGPARAESLLLQRCPEVVLGGVEDSANAWCVGSGMPTLEVLSGTQQPQLDTAHLDILPKIRASEAPVIADAGAMRYFVGRPAYTIVTPHAGELAQLLDTSVHAINNSPDAAALACAQRWDVVCCLKGPTTTIASPSGTVIHLTSACSWLATAGTGDVLAGILGALLATNARTLNSYETLQRIAATGVRLHHEAAALAMQTAAGEAPFTVRKLVAHIPSAFAQLRRTAEFE